MRKNECNNNSLAVTHPQLALEWDYKKNKLTPEEVSYGSELSVWWICSKCGHSWERSIRGRVRKNSLCPNFHYEDSLCFKCPGVLEYWDFKNCLDPKKLSPKSSKYVWWRCKEGHSWKAPIRNIVARFNKGLGVCSSLHKKDSLISTHPDVAKYWCHKKNILKPNQVSYGSHKEVWWENNGLFKKLPIKEMVDLVRKEIKGPRLFPHKTFETVYTQKDMIKYWDKSNTVDPREVSCNSNNLYWWRCEQGHSWEGSPKSLFRKILRRNSTSKRSFSHEKETLCKYIHIEDSLSHNYPNLLKKWDHSKNIIKPNEILCNSSKRVWWKCEKGHSWECPVVRMVRSSNKAHLGCKDCNKINRSIRMKGSKNHKWIKDRKTKRENDRFYRACRSLVRNSLKGLRLPKKFSSKEYLGYTIQDLKLHIFKSSNWEEVKNSCWHLDHIFPIKAFIDYNIRCIKLVNCLDNLQPLKARDNCRKNAKYDKAKFEEWLSSKKVSFNTQLKST